VAINATDFCLGDFWVSQGRAAMMAPAGSFTTTVHITNYIMVASIEAATEQRQSLSTVGLPLRPFRNDLWGCILLAIVVHAVAYWMAETIAGKRRLLESKRQTKRAKLAGTSSESNAPLATPAAQHDTEAALLARMHEESSTIEVQARVVAANSRHRPTATSSTANEKQSGGVGLGHQRCHCLASTSQAMHEAVAYRHGLTADAIHDAIHSGAEEEKKLAAAAIHGAAHWASMNRVSHAVAGEVDPAVVTAADSIYNTLSIIRPTAPFNPRSQASRVVHIGYTILLLGVVTFCKRCHSNRREPSHSALSFQPRASD
jgi:hypothetical protein